MHAKLEDSKQNSTRPKAKRWLKKHRICKLYFFDSEYGEEFDYCEGYTRSEAFEVEPSKTFKQRNKISKLVPVLSQEEKLSIKSKVEAMPLDERHKLVRKEIHAALLIIEKTLGHQWYGKAFKNYQEDNVSQHSINAGTTDLKYYYSGWGTNLNQLINKESHSNLDGYHYFPSVIALSDFFIGEYPENYLKICQFAFFINELWERTNAKVKINDYVRQERRMEELSLENFSKFFFELELAFFWIKNGFRVEFIPKGTTETPDFKIVSPQGITNVECKKKNELIPIEQRFGSFAKIIGRRLFECMEELKVNYEIDIKADQEIKSSEIEPIVSTISKALANNLECFTESMEHITIQGKKLLSYGKIELLKDIPDATKPAPSVGTRHILELFNPQDKKGRFISTHGCPNVEPYSPDTPLANFKRVIISAASSFIPNKVQSILNSVKDSTQLRSSGLGGSVLAIETALNEGKEAQDIIKQVFDSLPTIVETAPFLSAILILTRETIKDDNNQTIAAYKKPHVYKNPLATNPLPNDVEIAMKEGKCKYNISFFDEVWF